MSGKPELPKGTLGPQSKFSEFGLSTVSHNSPEIETASNQLEVKIRTSNPMKITANIIDHEKSEELQNHVLIQTHGEVVSLVVIIPSTGYYQLQIFALPRTDDSKTLVGVYNYLIHCTKAPVPVNMFPKQFAQWKEGCYIEEPMFLNSKSNLTKVKFRAYIPNTESVAVVAEGEWTHLVKGEDGLWEGEVTLEQYRGRDAKISLNANFGVDTKYSTLLEYRV
ncbi:hypothetical protein CHS0354_037763 [Potamilus streckersoni]|uniref:KY-like immunoglobulin-like domain-containing protein n=1 Tax=Potamilus streckersoni TaxID=2493646 RepID=A0AAE0W683_9BIVA|nr:hypothetical protein CHS0354_037763 [Potamilus streckersoni]